MQHKQSQKSQKQRRKRKMCQDFKENIESQHMETTYGTDVSLQTREKIRLSENFESYAECKKSGGK